jgi:hypothetical protein
MKFKAVLVLAALASAVNLANAADESSIDVTYSTGDTSISVSKNSGTSTTTPVPAHHAPKPDDFDRHHPDFAHEPPHDGKGPHHPDGKEPPHFDGRAPAHPDGKGPDFHAKDDGHIKPDMKNDHHDNDLHKNDFAHSEKTAPKKQLNEKHDAPKASNQYKDLRRKG